ncbi:MAG: molybdopterin biosynthesis protein MoeB [Gammaproteobacteria bacterium HGW-Gammaproteobacteria-8]|nr:MAG: molybdopterin biosynthesis protein MoeB [Gammaproteobacteria bacterium HGW-Gammaproteobacteria-8]
MAEQIAPEEAHRQALVGELRLIDLRDQAEVLASGVIEIAEPLADRPLPQLLAESRQAVALMCQRGVRSARLCAEAADSSPVRLLNVAGGFEAWRAAGLPVNEPRSPFSARERERYLRHFALPEVGEAGQLKLRRASVLLVGAGGLGSPAALYLAAAGLGRIVIVDDDRVERSNLQRQVLHAEAGIGQLKVDSASARLRALNPDIEIETRALRLGRDTVDACVADVDLVIDGSDNFPTRYLLNAACLRHARPLLYAAVERFSGQLGLFAPGRSGQPCYRCLFPDAPGPGEVPNCAEAGVLGVLPGIIGTLQTLEALKMLLGLGDSLLGQVLVVDGLQMSFRKIRVSPDPECPECGS